MKKICITILLFCFSSLGVFAETGVVITSPFFITNPFREIPVKQKTIKNSLIKKRDAYERIASTASMELYEHRLKHVYMIKVDLKNLLTVESLGTPVSWDESTGEPLYTRKTLKELKDEGLSPVTLAINGQFFDPKKNPTPLSFGLKDRGEVRTAGADNRSEKKKILIFGSGYAQMIPYSWENLRDTSGDFAFVSLSLDTPNFPLEHIGRTYICLVKPDDQNISERLLVFFTRSLPEYFAERALFSQGCTRDSSMKLDSSGSSQMIFADMIVTGDSRKGYPDNRKIPHAIGFSERIKKD